MYYAKTKPKIESIKEHTDSLLEEYNLLKSLYEKEINDIVGLENGEIFWKLLYLACYYHDFGKINEEFQNKIKRALGENIPQDKHSEIYHNFLSPALMTEEDRKSIDKDLAETFYQAIAYHHERDYIIDTDRANYIRDYIKNNLSERIDLINEEMGIIITKVSTKYLGKIKDIYRIKESNNNYRIYVMLKGLLHRLDHSGSAHINVEEAPNKCVGSCTNEYFKNKSWNLRRPQKFAIDNRNKNIVLIASTGIGKTETALFWINDSKAFITLPLRVSLNALYSRVKDEIKYESVGLLHSTALDYMVEKELIKGNFKIDDIEESFEETSLLSKKLCFSTIDQIFKFPFKYTGYEKILATLAYSKVVIDEIQAYSPEIAAVILYGIKQLYMMGGKFMIMTATLPRIYKEKLREFGISFEEEQCLSDKLRHKISVKNDDIMNSVDDVLTIGKEKKVLVIVNSVKQALDYFDEFQGRDVNVNLLHSMFINRDRSQKETNIKKFTGEDNHEAGIWITTQLVEASLDVDFDYLFTEMSPLDSLFQRFGRCYRKRSYNLNGPNIYIYTENVSGIGFIYDKDIFNISIRLLKQYNESFINEEVKVNLVDKLYSREMINGTKYFDKFQNSCEILESLASYQIDKNKAQKMLRDIDTIKVIPEDIFNENEELFEKLNSNNNKEVRREINKLIVSVPLKKIYCARYNGVDVQVNLIKNLRDIYLINSKYSKERGLILDELNDNIF